MPHAHRLAAALVGAVLALAGLPARAQYTPDPALLTASPAELQGRLRQSCAATQTRLTGTSPEVLDRLCACYASRTLRSFDRLEMQNFRTRGYFDDTGRDKAFKALQRCGLKRPPG